MVDGVRCMVSVVHQRACKVGVAINGARRPRASPPHPPSSSQLTPSLILLAPLHLWQRLGLDGRLDIRVRTWREREGGGSVPQPSEKGIQGHFALKKQPPPLVPPQNPRYSPTVASSRVDGS